MKLVLVIWILLALTACSSGSSTSELLENAKDILDQHACLEGTWQADTKMITINGQQYSISPNQAFLIITEPKDISELVNDANSINYAGLNLRTWATSNNQTQDMITESWVATLNSEEQSTSGTLRLINSCTNEYAGNVNDSTTPQCSSDKLVTSTHNMSLSCSDDTSRLTITSDDTELSFQRVHNNSSVTNFTSATDNPVNIEATLASNNQTLNDSNLLVILKQAYPGLSDEAYMDMLKQITTASVMQDGKSFTPPTTTPITPSKENNDSDNDGVNDDDDAFPDDPSEWSDLDQDGIGDNSDADIDGDNVLNNADAFPYDASEWSDLDNDGTGDNSDTDIDGDTHANNVDAFPYDATEWSDQDGDGTGDNSDTDIDGDTYLNGADAFPYDATEWSDLDGDGTGDNSDTDIDGDSHLNTVDAFPYDASEWSDLDGDGTGDNTDTDIDGDGYLNEDDIAPLDPSIPGTATLLFKQDFSSFENGSNWYLTDFNLPEQPAKTDYTNDETILFNIQWTKRTRKLLADRFGYERSEMTKELANSLCPAKIEVGRASTYQSGNSDNMVAELDTDLYHCNIHGNEPANVRIRSFIPTQIGYRYRLSSDYKMRSYSSQPVNAYRHFVMGFAGNTEHFPSEFDSFTTANIEITAFHKFSRVVLADNGLPDSYGILVDNIQVEELGKVPHFDACASIYALNSKGFKQCIRQEVDTNQTCGLEAMTVNYRPKNVSPERMNTDFLFLQEGSITNRINFVSLGIKGKLTVRCLINGYPALYPVHNKTLSLNEISWGNATPANYPEQGRISVKLSHCEEEQLNGHIQLGTISTSERFEYDFSHNDMGQSYEGCRLKQLIIKDKTPNSSPSTDGIDLNSLNFTDIE